LIFVPHRLISFLSLRKIVSEPKTLAITVPVQTHSKGQVKMLERKNKIPLSQIRTEQKSLVKIASCY